MAHTPAVAGDSVFIGSCNGVFRALDRRTGAVRWETRVAPDAAQYFFHGDPYITADTIVIGADAQAGGGVHAFDRATGRERWKVGHPVRRQWPNGWHWRACIRLRSAAGRGPDPMAAERREELEHQPRVRVANTVLLGTSSGELTGYCVADGTKAWSHNVRGSVRSIGGSDDALYVTTQAGSLDALQVAEPCRPV